MKKKTKVRYRDNVTLIPKERLGRYPITSFGEIKPLLIEIQFLHNKDEIIHTALIEHAIVKTVTIFEVYFKSIAYIVGSKLVDKLDLVLSGNYENDPANAFAHSGSHASPSRVKIIYEELLGIDIMEEAKKYYDNFNNEGVEHESCHIRNIPPLRDNWENFDDIFYYRNKIVHENVLPPTDYKKLRNMVGSVFDVMVIAGGKVHYNIDVL